jgi:hypothetical protein
MTLHVKLGRPLILLISLSHLGSGQNFSGGFNFYLPPTDTGSTRFIPPFVRTPLTDQDFVATDPNGHFSVRGAPMRFFGANLVADGAFPTASKAWFVAGRLRKMGFNLVRFHHMDNPWSTASLFEQGWTTRQLNPLTLDRLESILAGLKSNGIYADINLHVGRTFTAMDGLPDTDSLQEYGKAINYFDPDVLSLHKEFARELLTHISPYTGTSLANDPVMAMVELTNENSLYRYWRDGKLKHLSQGGILTARHVRMIDSLWLAFLERRYSSTFALAQAWNAGAHPSDGLNRIVNGTFETVPPSTGWVMEIQAPSAAAQARDSLTSSGGKFSARVTVSRVDGTDWHVQWKQTSLSVTKDTTYVITFAARSDSTRPISVALMRDVSPWTWYGGVNLQLTPAWKVYSFNVRPTESLTFGARLSFTLGAGTGSYWFDDISLTTSAVSGLLADESLESRLVRRIDYAGCAGFTPARVSDMSSFYLVLEEEYYAAMRGYLRDSLNVRVPVVGTNWNAGPPDLAVQSKQDYVDNHSYWDHPAFPGIPWSSTDWNIANTPMVRQQGGATIAQLFAGAPAEGKPYTVSEYNHAFPNRYQSEALLFLTSYAAFHDADGLMFFEYSSSDDWETDRVANYFSIHRNSAMMALVPSCAAAFRGGLISPARQKLLLDYAPADFLTFPRRDTFGWTGWSIIDQTLALQHGVRSASFTSATPFDPSALPPPPVNPFVTDTKEISWNTDGLLSVAAPRFAGATGFLNAFTGQQVGPLTITAATGFGSLTWISLTADSLGQARRSLLTLSSMSQNSGMVWDGTTTIHNNWGGSPTQVAPLLVTLQLRMNADSIRVYPLDPSGGETRGFSTYVPSAPNTFHPTIDQSRSLSMWFGIEAFGNGTATTVSGDAAGIPLENRLEQNFPNPFNPATLIRYQVSAALNVRLAVYDVLGREVAVLVSEQKAPGTYAVSFDGTNLASGMYFYTLTTGRYRETRKLMVTR